MVAESILNRPTSSLDLISTTTIVIASMIGVGVYTTSGFTLLSLQSPHLVVLAWAVGGGIAICGAVGYSTLATHFQESGGEYLFLSKTVHPAAGIMAGWVSMLAGFTGAIAAAALGIEEYVAPGLNPLVESRLSQLPLPGSDDLHLPANSIAIFCVVLAGWLHCVGVRLAARIQNGIVLMKLLMLGFFIVVASFSIGTSNQGFLQSVSPSTPVDFDLLSFAKQLVWISFSYAGFNAAIYISGEVSDSQRNVPRAMILGTSIVTLLYVILNACFVYGADPEVITGGDNLPKIAAVAAEAVGGITMRNFVTVVIITSLFTSVSALIMTGPRVYAKMAEDRFLPSAFSLRGQFSILNNDKSESIPKTSIVFQCGAAILVICISSLSELLGYLGLTLSLCSAMTVGSIYFIRDTGSWAAFSTRRKYFHYFASTLFVVATLILAGLYALGEFLQNKNLNPVIAALITLGIGWGSYLRLRKQGRGSDKSQSEL